MKQTLNELARLFGANAQSKGFWLNYLGTTTEISEKLMLCVGELAEAQEELRKGTPPNEMYYSEGGKPEGFGVELADCLIRILDLMHQLGIDIESTVELKHAYNMKRPFLHGKRF
jgi:NTP pyrophosphatase (non-canonical NTP hydrolase)